MTPVLWHIEVSHYNEKARWALDYKEIPHRRRVPMPGLHGFYALAITRGGQRRLPVLQLNGHAIGDSTAIIAALEEHRPDPPLYPEDPAERARALALEDYFDHATDLEAKLEADGKHDLVEALRSSNMESGSIAYIRQHRALGLGHAVGCARRLIGDEPFAVILPDDVIAAEKPCLQQMVEAHAETGGSMVAAMDREGFGVCSMHRECEAVCPKEISVNFIARMNWERLRAGFTRFGE